MYYTGVIKVELLTDIFRILLPHTNQIKLDEKSTSKKRLRNRKSLKLFEEFLLTLVRIRRGFDLKYLADVFVISESHASRLFKAWVPFLAFCLEDKIVWPSQEINSANLPTCFYEFDKTIAIIDCTEYTIQQPIRPKAQKLTPKHRKTVNSHN